MSEPQPSEPPLPPGWIVCKSKKFSDRVYFFNVDTGQSLWEPPDFQSPLLRIPTSPIQTSTPIIIDLACDEIIDSKAKHQIKKPIVNNPTPQKLDIVEPMEVDEIVTQVRRKSNFEKTPVSSCLENTVKLANWDFASLAERQNVMVCLVVDTNIWLRHFDFLGKIEKMKFNGSNAVIVIPYVVLQELDFIKDSYKKTCTDSGQIISDKAAMAIDFVYNHICKRHSRFILCQTAQFDLEGHENFPQGCASNDERVLKCLLQIKENLGGGASDRVAMLCTNDKGLLLKASAHNCVAGSYSHVQVLLNDICKVPEKYLDENQPSTSSNKPIELNIKSVLANIPSGSNFDELIDYCKQCLSKIIDQEFRRIYEHMSDTIYVIKPPWQSLKTVLEVILKHWVSVYRYMWKSPDEIQQLYKLLATKTKFKAQDQIQCLNLMLSILKPFKDRPSGALVFSITDLYKKLTHFVYLGENPEPEEPVQSGFVYNKIKETPLDQVTVKVQTKRMKCNSEMSVDSLELMATNQQSQKCNVVNEVPMTSFTVPSIGTIAGHELARRACAFVWNLLRQKREDWETELRQAVDNRDKQALVVVGGRLRFLVHLTQTLLDAMDAVFMDNPDPQVRAPSAVKGAIKFTMTLVHVAELLMPGDAVCKDNATIPMHIFRAYVLDKENIKIFESAGDYLFEFVKAIEDQLRICGF